MAGTLEVPEEGSSNASQDPKIKVAIKAYNESLGAGNKLEGKEIVAESIKNAQVAPGMTGRLYKPTIIATEQERTNTAFATLTTADEVKEVVLPENGLIVVDYLAIVKSSVSGAGRVAVFVGANQLKVISTTTPEVAETSTSETKFTTITSAAGGLSNINAGTSYVTTGMATGSSAGGSGQLLIFAAAGTYNISIQYRATSGSITAKERKLWVGVLGV